MKRSLSRTKYMKPLFAILLVLFGLATVGWLPGDENESTADVVADQAARPEGDFGGPAARLEKDLGGPAALLDFFSTRSEADIRAKLSAYGMGYVRHSDVAPSNEEASLMFGLEDPNAPRALALPEGARGDPREVCPQLYDEPESNAWHSVNGEHYYVDASGRPQSAYSYLPPIASEPRRPRCQASVGHWGRAEDPSQVFEGGHLIGAQLGGWGLRANLVPQNQNFNRGNWAQLENAMVKCSSLGPNRMMYRASVNYGDSTTRLVPQTFQLLLQDRSSGGDSATLNFANAHGGGANGTNERIRGAQFLESKGCNGNPPHAIQPHVTGRLRMMVVGDSITHSAAGTYSWRYHLHQHLLGSGVSFDFVGPYDRAHGGYYAAGGWDYAHAAAWGQATLEAKETIGEDVAIYQPDVILVHLGTNDLTWWGGSPESTARDMAELIARARESKPDVDIVLAQIGDTSQLTDEESAGYASKLAELAQATNTASSRVVTANVYGIWNWASDATADTTHPNARGDYVIAKAFADSLSQNLGIGPPFGPIPLPAGPPKPTGLVVSPNVITPTTPFSSTWNRVVNPGIWTTYKVQIRNHKNFGFKLIWESPETPNTSVPYLGPTLGYGVYHVVVVALDGTNQTMSNEVPLEVRSSVGPPKPAPPGVVPGMVTPSMPFFITWPRVNNPGVWTTYKVQVRHHKNFGFGLVWESASTPNTSVAYTGPPLVLGVHHVVVLAMDGTYETMSDPSPLEVRSTVGPPKPTGVAVTPKSILPGQTFFVTWPRVTNPGVWTTYKVQIRNHFNFGFGLIWESAPTADLAIGYTGRLEPGQYHIVVVAMDGTYEASSDIAPLEVKAAPAPIFRVQYPDLGNPLGEGIAYMRFGQHSEPRAYVASRFGWPSCGETSHYGFDVWVTVSQVSSTRLFFHGFTIIAKENAVGFGAIDLVSGPDNLFHQQIWPDQLYEGQALNMTVDKWMNLNGPAYGYMRFTSGTWFARHLSCYRLGTIDFRPLR